MRIECDIYDLVVEGEVQELLRGVRTVAVLGIKTPAQAGQPSRHRGGAAAAGCRRMSGFFNIYQYAAPLVILPLSYWLWLERCAGQHRLAALMLAIPVLYAYIVPAVGTNVLRIWEFNTRLRLGRFRPHHGFVFG